jgi:GT2 family glycosyltransferase
MKDINIVYVNYLLKDELLRSLNSLIHDLEGCPLDYQITVVDNSQNRDGVKESLAKIAEVKYLNPGGNVGFGAGNNFGFKDTLSKYMLSLNCDTEVEAGSGFIQSMIKFMDEHPKIGCIGPKVLNMDGSVQNTCYRFDLPSIFIKPLKQINFDKKYAWVKKHADKLEMKDFSHDETRPVDWVLGAAMMVRREVSDAVGMYDERYFMYMEDCDWCHKMWDNGWPVYYVHSIVLKHTHNRDSAKVPGIVRAFFKNKLARIHFVSWLKYLWKWRGQHKYYASIS